MAHSVHKRREVRLRSKPRTVACLILGARMAAWRLYASLISAGHSGGGTALIGETRRSNEKKSKRNI